MYHNSDSVVSRRDVAKEAVDWGTIVVIGQKVWDVISDNRPSANLNASSASVVPVRSCSLSLGVGPYLTPLLRHVQEGITSWQQLTNWKGPVVVRDTITYSLGVRCDGREPFRCGRSHTPRPSFSFFDV